MICTATLCPYDVFPKYWSFQLLISVNCYAPARNLPRHEYGENHSVQSLGSTIIGMAQNFVGSNNVNVLSPEGQFGTREQVWL